MTALLYQKTLVRPPIYVCLCIHTSVLAKKKMWKGNSLLLVQSLCEGKGRGQNQQWLENRLVENIINRCFWVMWKDVHNFVLKITNFPSEKLEDICPSFLSCQEHSFYYWLPEKICHSDNIFLCHRRNTLYVKFSIYATQEKYLS